VADRVPATPNAATPEPSAPSPDRPAAPSIDALRSQALAKANRLSGGNGGSIASNILLGTFRVRPQEWTPRQAIERLKTEIGQSTDRATLESVLQRLP
jgi:hypothetical protein